MVVHSPPRASGMCSITTVPYPFPEEPLNYFTRGSSRECRTETSAPREPRGKAASGNKRNQMLCSSIGGNSCNLTHLLLEHNVTATTELLLSLIAAIW